MRTWLLNVSEQLAFEGSGRRPMRTGMLARALLRRGHEVVWWKSTFEHASKRHYRRESGMESPQPGLTVGWLHSPGYRGHVSIARYLDHRAVARGFSASCAAQPAPDTIVCSYPVPELALAGIRYGRERGIPVVLDIRDWWPDALVYAFPRPFRSALKLLFIPYERAVRRACIGAAAITGITPAFVDWGLAHAGRPRGPMDRDFPHGYDLPALSASEAKEAGSYWDALGVSAERKRFVLCFIGSISRSFDFAPLIQAAAMLHETGSDALIVICGDGDRRPHVEAMAGAIPNIVFTRRWVGGAEIQTLLQRASAGLVPLPDRPDFLATINNKTIEYLAAGLPLIASPPHSYVGELVSREGLGVIWSGTNAGHLVDAVHALSERPDAVRAASEHARRCFSARFDAEAVYSGFATFLETLAGTRPKPLSA